MQRRKFIKESTFSVAAFANAPFLQAKQRTNSFPEVRISLSKRKFTSKAVEETITKVHKTIGNKTLAWMFENCYPNTLATTILFSLMVRQLKELVGQIVGLI